MKFYTFVLLLTFCYVQCRKTFAPIDKNANIAFINMEAGGAGPGGNTARLAPPAPSKGPIAPVPTPQQPVTTLKPAVITPKLTVTTVKQAPLPAPTTSPPNLIRPKPVNPSPVANPITTPGPGTVKQLVNFYDSQGKASPIRPYSYSQAVKQG